MKIKQVICPKAGKDCVAPYPARVFCPHNKKHSFNRTINHNCGASERRKPECPPCEVIK